MRISFLILAVLVMPGPLFGAETPTPGFPITIHIPEELCQPNRGSVDCKLSDDGESLAIGGKVDWESQFMPVAHEATIKKWRFKKGLGELTARDLSRTWTVKVLAATEDESLRLLWSVHSPGGRKGKRAGELFAKLAAKYAASVFPTVGDTEARNLLVASVRTLSAQRIESVEYRDNIWAAIDLGRDPGGLHYNTLQLSKDQRAATEIKRRILPAVKALGVTVRRAAPLEGVKFTLEAGSRNFLNNLEPIRYDRIELYIQRDVSAAFASDEITSQELVERSIVLVDENRTAIDLSTAKAD